MAGQYGRYQDDFTSDTSRFPTPAIIKPFWEMRETPGKTIGFFDDFDFSMNPGTITTADWFGPWKMIAESGGDITASATPGGQITLVAGTTGDADTIMTYGDGAPFIIDLSGSKRLGFEARFHISTITDAAEVQFFVGLAEEARAAAAGLFSGSGSGTANTALADIDMLGFARFDDDGDALAWVYGKASGTAYEVTGQIATLAVSTYVKAGFVFDPTARTITPYINGVPQRASIIGNGSTDPGLNATTFPLGEEMTPVVGITPDTTTTGVLTLDWIYCYQEM